MSSSLESKPQFDPWLFSDVPIFILYQGYPPHVGEAYQKRLALADDAGTGEKASLLIKKVRRDDEGWYECKGNHNL